MALFAIFAASAAPLAADDFEDALNNYYDGDYAKAEEASDRRVDFRYGRRRYSRDSDSEAWGDLHIRATAAQGKYQEAYDDAYDTLDALPWSLRLRWRLYELASILGEDDVAKRSLAEMNQLAGQNGDFFDTANDQVTLGRMAVALGADPRLALKNFFDPAQRQFPNTREVYEATGELALSKRDFQLAADAYRDGIDKFPNNPDLFYGLARALEPSDREGMAENIQKALTRNPNHTPSRLLLVDSLIDAEAYEDALGELETIESVNPNRPELWAYRAIIAHLLNDSQAELNARERAMSLNPRNADIPSLIGKKLSEKYRFVEGATYQRIALSHDEDHPLAKLRLASDLLKLGDIQEGWLLAEEAFEADGYNVSAYNLVTLRDNLESAKGIRSEHFVVYMDPLEASVYGPDVLETLEHAYSTLTEKYGYTPPGKTRLEIFKDPKDFEVRTFGMPNIPGYLAVCFGPVITANSPASSQAAFNWKSVLWHEFCHTITLGLTRNKMPRWLSEGISVYEERLADPAWGQRLNLEFHELIEAGDFVPIGDLSSAFMRPKSAAHVQLAYFQSSLVVEMIVTDFGLDALRNCLTDLGRGYSITQALEENTEPLDSLNQRFNAYVDRLMKDLAPGLELSQPTPHLGGPIPLFQDIASEIAEKESPEESAERYPNNYWALRSLAESQIESGDYQNAKETLNRILDGYPNPRDSNSAHHLLAGIHRANQDTDQELDTLRKIASLTAESPQTYRRLIELSLERNQWRQARRYAEKLQAVTPLDYGAYDAIASASAELEEFATERNALEAAARLDPPDPARVHFRLAEIYRDDDPSLAKNHTLRALEAAPRFKDAYKLLLALKSEEPSVSARQDPKPDSPRDYYSAQPEDAPNPQPESESDQ